MVWNLTLIYYSPKINFNLKNKIQDDTVLADELITKGNILEDNGDVHNALVQYQNALKAAPNYWAVFLNMGIAYDVLGDLSKALPNFKKANELNPNSHITAYNYARVLYRLNENLDKVDQLLTQATEIKPDFFEAYVLLAQVNFDKSNEIESLHLINKALELQPEHMGALLNKATYLIALSRQDVKYEAQVLEMFQKFSNYD